MTGYGRGECARDGFKITVELSAVNRRQPEISVNLPRELEMLESPVRDAINAQVARGRVTARIGIHAADGKFGGAGAPQPAAGQGLRDGAGAAGEVAENFRRSDAGSDFARAGRFPDGRGTGGRGKNLAGARRRRSSRRSPR